jgi:pilus assembly protein FimV
MSSGKNPLVWMMALTMPGAAQALGLGDIHVDSGLNERLAAEIDIVGASALELAELKAALANRETFARFGADRPAFLTSTTFKVTQDSQGRPVLALRSTESFTEPVVNILVDLNWRTGQLVRQYTLLLDPAGFSVAPTPTPTPAAVAAPVVAAPVVAATPAAAGAMAPAAMPTPAVAATPDPSPARAVRKTTHIKVGAKATLRGIAWRAGERSESDLQRMMLAIFRANPHAFDGNINRLHRGALLTIPSHAEAAAISNAEAKREISAQMTAWRTPGPTATAGRTATVAAARDSQAPLAAAPVAAVTAASIPAAAERSGETEDTPATERLDHRVQSLEKELSEMQALLTGERAQLLALQRQAAGEQKPTAVALPPVTTNAPHAQAKSGSAVFVPVIAAFGALTAGMAAALLRRRRRVVPTPNTPLGIDGATPTADAATDGVPGREDTGPQSRASDSADAPSVAETASPADAGGVADAADAAAAQALLEAEANAATHPALPVLPADKPTGHGEAAHDTTVNLLAKTVNLRMDTTRLDYNFLDLDLTAQHVQMPSVLNESAVVKERRTNLADVLKLAIEREPDRQDLRMKLLELYYSAAATNRTAFLEVVQKLARNRDLLQADQWDKIAFMGRQIAGENPMFAEPDDEDLADCA